MNVAEVLTGLGRPVVFYPQLALALGGVYECVFLCQLLYWSDKGRDPEGWIWKSRDEFLGETGMTRWTQKSARERLLRLGVIEERYERLEHRMFFRVNTARLQEVFEQTLVAQKADSPAEGGETTFGKVEGQPSTVPKSQNHRRYNNSESTKPQKTTTMTHERVKEKARRNSTVGVVFSGVVQKEKKAEEAPTGTPSGEEMAQFAAQLGEEFGLSPEQIAVDARKCIERHGVGHAQEQAELVRRYLQQHGGNAAKLMISALRKPWRAPKTVPPSAKIKRATPPPASDLATGEFPQYEPQQRLWERASEAERERWLQDEMLRSLAPQGNAAPRPAFLFRLYTLTHPVSSKTP